MFVLATVANIGLELPSCMKWDGAKIYFFCKALSYVLMALYFLFTLGDLA